MALADVTTTAENRAFIVELLASAIAANGIPSGASAGISTALISTPLGYMPDSIAVGVKSTAGSATMSATVRPWIYAGAIWFALPALTALAETSADSIQQAERVSGIAGASRLYLEITAIGGTSTAITGFAIVGRAG